MNENPPEDLQKKASTTKRKKSSLEKTLKP